MKRKPVFGRTSVRWIQWFSVLVLTVVFPVLTDKVFAAEHTVEKGETALQIAIDHDLTMDQLSQLNPETDLEMMRVGDVLTVPDKGTSFDEFLDSRYSKMLRIDGLACVTAADHHAVCFFHAENISEYPLYDIRLKTSVQGANGARGEAEAGVSLIQIMPGERIPVCTEVQGVFDGQLTASVKSTVLSWSELFSSSFRIAEDRYEVSAQIFPDGIGADVTLRFSADALTALREKKINVLSAAYAADGSLIGIRSLYTDLFPEVSLTIYSVGPVIDSVSVWLEAY